MINNRSNEYVPSYVTPLKIVNCVAMQRTSKHKSYQKAINTTHMGSIKGRTQFHSVMNIIKEQISGKLNVKSSKAIKSRILMSSYATLSSQMAFH